MKKKSSLLYAICTILGSTLAGLAGSAVAQDRTGRTEVGPFVGGYLFDDDLDLKNSVVGGARAGYWLTDRLLTELSLAGVRTREKSGDDRASLLLGQADLLYHLDLGWKVEPFLAAGLGTARYDARARGGKSWDFLVDYGVGARYWINDRIAARVDVRQPVTFSSPRFNLLYTAGLSFVWGGTAAVQKAEAPAAAPAPPPPVPTATLTASPNSIERGKSTTLSWTTQGANEVSIDDLGTVEPSGSRSVTPLASTTYRLAAKGDGGRATATTSVSVSAPPPPPASVPTATLTANPSQVKWGEATTLSWATENATDVSIDGLGSVQPNGSQRVTPNVATRYHLVARGPGGTAEATAPVAIELPDAVCITLMIEFDFDKSDIKPKYHREVGKVAEFLKSYPKTTAVIEGHTDSVGTQEYNERLSLRRADAVVAYLVDKYSIEPSRLSSRGYGFSRPVADNATAEGRQLNRRINAIIDCVIK